MNILKSCAFYIPIYHHVRQSEIVLSAHRVIFCALCGCQNIRPLPWTRLCPDEASIGNENGEVNVKLQWSREVRKQTKKKLYVVTDVFAASQHASAEWQIHCIYFFKIDLLLWNVEMFTWIFLVKLFQIPVYMRFLT